MTHINIEYVNHHVVQLNVVVVVSGDLLRNAILQC